MKADPPLSGGTATIGFSFAGSRRRSRHPSRERRIHLKMRLAFSLCRRATAATEGARRKSLRDDPLALVEASRSTPLPSSVIRRHLVSTSDSGGHLIQSKCAMTGGRQMTLTIKRGNQKLRLMTRFLESSNRSTLPSYRVRAPVQARSAGFIRSVRGRVIMRTRRFELPARRRASCCRSASPIFAVARARERTRLVIDRAPADVQNVRLAGNREIMRSVDHRFALSRPALVSTPSKNRSQRQLSDLRMNGFQINRRRPGLSSAVPEDTGGCLPSASLGQFEGFQLGRISGSS